MPQLPPLLSERPPAVRFAAIVVGPLIAGALTGAMLGVSGAAWAIANVLATVGGFLVGFDHDDLRGAARRGALGGLLFGLALVAADAVVVGDRAATIADPAILQAVVTSIAGTLLALAGCAVRARLARRAALAEPAVVEPAVVEQP